MRFRARLLPRVPSAIPGGKNGFPSHDLSDHVQEWPKSTEPSHEHAAVARPGTPSNGLHALICEQFPSYG